MTWTRQRSRAPRSLTRRWRAAGAEGGPVSVRVEYAEDGTHFRTIGFSANPEGMSLPLRLFSAAKAARLRLVANDGLNETTVTSAPFASPGEPPSVAILEPASDLKMLSTGVLNLTGQAFDDRSQVIAAKDLRWTLDGALWGENGATRTLIQPAPGRHVITFQAKDRLGRQTLAHRIVYVINGGIKRVYVPPNPRRNVQYGMWLLVLLAGLIIAGIAVVGAKVLQRK